MTWTYNTNTANGSGGADGSMTIIGGPGQLSQSNVNSAINNYNATPGQTVSLISVVVEGTFTSLGPSTFQSTGFTSIVFSVDSQLENLGSSTFYLCTKLTNLVLPPKITEMAYFMCYSCSLLKTVVIPESVTKFNGYGFYDCAELEHMVIPSKVAFMTTYEFAGCPKLVSIEFLNPSLGNISGDTFTSTSNIRFMKVPRNLWTNNINPGNTSLRPILQFHGEPGYQTWNGSRLITGNGMTIDINGGITGNYDGTLVINQNGQLSSSVIIGIYLSFSTRFLDLVVTLGSGVTALGTDVFSGMTGLTEIKFDTNNAVTAFNARCFQGCSSLKSIIIPPGVTTVGDNVFQGCTLLEGVVFPESLTTLGTTLFEGCTSLQDIVFPESLNTISGTAILAGTTAMRTLKIQESLYEQMSLVENKDYAQLVQFYGETKILQPLKTQLDYWNGLEGVGGTKAGGYQKVIDYYSTRGVTYSVDYSGGTTATLVKGVLGGSEFDVTTGTLSKLGTYDGALTIVGNGELTRTMVDAAMSAHSGAQNGIVPLRTLTVGPNFTSLETTLSLQGTGLTSLVFPAESPITTTGVFELSIDSTLAQTVVLPRWVVNQGSWSLI
jgi:hypothetical protein